MKCLLSVNTYKRELLLLFLISNVTNSNKIKPHIIIILADDLGWNDFGFHGSNQIPTPNIDALAYNGVILDKFYTQQSCSPSRAALLTGNYPIRSGLQGIPLSAGENRSIPMDMPILPEKLKTLGYKTHLVGKWHLGHAYRRVLPTGRGFDHHFGYWNGYIGYFDYTIKQEIINRTRNFTGYDLHDDITPQWKYKGKYATELFTEKSLQVIEEHDKNSPLFLVLAHLAGHTGQDGIELGVPNITRTNQIYSYIDQPERRRIADIVNLMDESVGRIVNKLSENNMLENSIIIFFSDNGAQTIGMYQNFASNWPFRGLKFSLYEGGVRGSCVIFSPLLKQKGYINEQLMHISDWFPTLYYAAGGNPEDLGNIDGINQWEVLSQNQRTNRTEILLNIEDKENLSGILGLGGKYKLLNGTYQKDIYGGYYGDSGRSKENPSYDTQGILNSLANVAIQNLSEEEPLSQEKINITRNKLDKSWCRTSNATPQVNCSDFCLFDIYEDPCETINIIDDQDKQSIVDVLKNRLKKFWSEIVPQIKKGVDLKSNPSFCNNTWFTWLDENNNCENNFQTKFSYEWIIMQFKNVIFKKD